MASDAKAIRAFANGSVKEINVAVAVATYTLWQVKAFRSNSAVAKMLGLMLAHNHPVDLINGQVIDVDKSLAWSNDKEYHHVFPQQFLAQAKPIQEANIVGNIVLLTSASNIYIS